VIEIGDLFETVQRFFFVIQLHINQIMHFLLPVLAMAFHSKAARQKQQV
jgi:hypothetical protein